LIEEFSAHYRSHGRASVISARSLDFCRIQSGNVDNWLLNLPTQTGIQWIRTSWFDRSIYRTFHRVGY